MRGARVGGGARVARDPVRPRVPDRLRRDDGGGRGCEAGPGRGRFECRGRRLRRRGPELPAGRGHPARRHDRRRGHRPGPA